MVVPPERRATLQTARKGASRKGFDALARAVARLANALRPFDAARASLAVRAFSRSGVRNAAHGEC